MFRIIILVATDLLALTPSPRANEPEPEEPEESAVASSATSPMEIGPRLGLATGFGGLTPGGLRAGGVLLYRLSAGAWFDGEAAFSFGSSEAECYLTRSRAERMACAHGLADGFGAQIGGGLRWFMPRRGAVEPYVRAGLAVAAAHFGGDDLSGLALPAWAGGGFRSQVAPRISVGGEALAQAGPAFFGRDLGGEWVMSLILQLGVEFQL